MSEENKPRGGYTPNLEGELKSHPGRSGQDWYREEPAPAFENHPKGNGAVNDAVNTETQSKPRGGYTPNLEGELKSHPGRSGEDWYREEPAPTFGNHPKGNGAPQSENGYTLTPEQLAVVAKRIGEIMNPEPDQSLTA